MQDIFDTSIDIFDTSIKNLPIGLKVGDDTYIDSCEDNRIFLKSDDVKAWVDWNIIKVYKDNYKIVIRKPVMLTNNKYGDFEGLSIYNGSSVTILANEVRNLNIECNYLNCEYSHYFENCDIKCSVVYCNDIIKFHNCDVDATNLNISGYYDSIYDVVNNNFDESLESDIEDLPLQLGIGNIKNTNQISLRKDKDNYITFRKEQNNDWKLIMLINGWYDVFPNKTRFLNHLKKKI